MHGGNLARMEDVEVVAALTDQSTPLQPEGTTQNLQEIDKLEKSEFNVTSYHEFFDRFQFWLVAAAALLLLEILLRTLVFRKVP